MRIISGIAKGRRIKGPPGRQTRPMTDRAREGLFSAIGAELPGADVLDLYAGSGSLGLEALSRGSATAVFVERDSRALAVLRANVASVGLGGQVIPSDVDRFLATTSKDTGGFDLAFVDPPYRNSPESVETTLHFLAALIRTGGGVVVHRLKGERRLEAVGLRHVGEHTYGSTRIWRYRRVSDGS